MTRRVGSVRAAAALALVTAAVTLPSTGASTATPAPLPRIPSGDFVEPQLLRELSASPALAVFAWDRREARRAEVLAHLRRQGFGFHLFDNLPVGTACLGGAAQLPGLARTPGVRSVYADAELTPALDRSVPTAFNGDPGHMWGVEGVTGEGVGIAVIDTGIDGTHPDLAFGSRIKRNVVVLASHQDATGQDLCPNPDTFYPPEYGVNPVTGEPYEDLADTETSSGHGTHLAGVAAGDGTASDGRLKGMAPEADLFGIQVIGDASPVHEVSVDDQTTYKTSLVRMIAAINYLKSWGVDREEISVKVALLGFAREGLYDPYSPGAVAIRSLWENEIAVVMPAGNEGPGASDCTRAETCHYNALAMQPFVIGVGASPPATRTTLEGYSSRGDPATEVLDPNAWPTPVRYRYEPLLVAPGTGVMSARRVGLAGVVTVQGHDTLGAGGSSKQRAAGLEYQAFTGTSVAAAHVAGTIALMQQAAREARGSYLPVEQIYRILEETATPMPGYGRHEVGAGMVDATAAIWAARFAG